MGRCRFVQPGRVRIFLADAAKHTYQVLEAQVAAGKAKPEELVFAAARVTAAEEDAQFIDVKAELNAGEQRHVFTDLVREANSGEAMKLDPARIGITKLVAYLLGWSFVDFQGQPVPITEDAINLLDTDTFRELVEAVDWHEEQVEAARAARKNGRSGESTSPAISPSPSAAAGASSGSVN
jgi:hypothetical protein